MVCWLFALCKGNSLLNSLRDIYKGKNVVFIAVSFSDKKEILAFIKKYPFKYHLIPFQKQYISKLHIKEYPTNIIVDEKGITKYVSADYDDKINEDLNNVIETLMKS